MLARLAHLVTRYRWAVIGVWIVLTLFGAYAAGQVSKRWYQSFSIPGKSAYEANQRTLKTFGTHNSTHVDADVIRGMTLTGTRDELVERIRGIKALGFNQIQLHTAPGQETDMLERWADVMERV